MSAFKRALDYVRVANQDFSIPISDDENDTNIKEDDDEDDMRIKKNIDDYIDKINGDDKSDDSSAGEEELTNDNNKSIKSIGRNEARRVIGFIVPKTFDDESVGFSCTLCPNVKLLRESDAASHTNSKCHRKAFNQYLKAKWTPEMIEARKNKNKRKRLKRIEKHRELVSSKDKTSNPIENDKKKQKMESCNQDKKANIKNICSTKTLKKTK